MALLARLAAANPAAFPDSDRASASGSRGRRENRRSVTGGASTMSRGALTREATLPSPGVAAPHRIAACAVTIALAAAPAAAVAQNGAGDEQYQDPFSGGSQQPASKPKPKPAPSQQHAAPSTQQSAPSTSQSAPSTSQSAPSAQQTTATTQQRAAAQQLPRTGLDVLPLVIGGIALVAAGLALRRRAAHDR
jgi:hypothetical protein